LSGFFVCHVAEILFLGKTNSLVFDNCVNFSKGLFLLPRIILIENFCNDVFWNLGGSCRESLLVSFLEKFIPACFFLFVFAHSSANVVIELAANRWKACCGDKWGAMITCYWLSHFCALVVHELTADSWMAGCSREWRAMITCCWFLVNASGSCLFASIKWAFVELSLEA
jgi:hypothetical protein